MQLCILEVGSTRLIPILMTALVTIGAEGSGLISKGLGVTVIGGLTSSKLLINLRAIGIRVFYEIPKK